MGGWAASKISAKYNIPLIITEHSSMFTRNLIPTKYIPLIEDTLLGASQVIAVGPSLQREVRKYTEKDVHVIPNIVNVDDFIKERSKSTRSGKFKFFSLAILKKNKGMDVLLESFAKAFKGDKNVELLIGGEGDEKQNLIQLSEKLDIISQVKFLGALERSEVVREMQECDSFVLASRSETFGVVYIEALAAGKPIIATNCGGPSIIVNKNNGFLVEVDNIGELSKALIKMKNDINFYDEKLIKEDTARRFGDFVISKQVYKLYSDSIKQSKAK
ncbi:glycosyltransferase [Bhargavaea ginsengi]|uniref:glycosyltransferase n=1 Tax=Bhargavaea ginsengi TaxID=426757 RepID=UPI00203FBEE5|nr:glycosyltransferase [Bhargavaea ginsengi]MCM3088668.1 glycosyltransferase [Bhargavaea ginsengi]